MKLGDKKILTQVCIEQCCEECGEPAKYKHTYLFDNARNNRASSAYGRDDCSWCEDEHKYACEEHKEKIRRDEPFGMSWCSTFTRNDRFEHMFLYWKILKEEVEPPNTKE